MQRESDAVHVGDVAVAVIVTAVVLLPWIGPKLVLEDRDIHAAVPNAHDDRRQLLVRLQGEASRRPDVGIRLLVGGDVGRERRDPLGSQRHPVGHREARAHEVLGDVAADHAGFVDAGLQLARQAAEHQRLGHDLGPPLRLLDDVADNLPGQRPEPPGIGLLERVAKRRVVPAGGGGTGFEVGLGQQSGRQLRRRLLLQVADHGDPPERVLAASFLHVHREQHALDVDQRSPVLNIIVGQELLEIGAHPLGQRAVRRLPGDDVGDLPLKLVTEAGKLVL